MGNIFEQIGDWIKQGLIDAIMGSFEGMFDAINQQVGDVAAQVGQTPQGWNAGVFTMIRTLSELQLMLLIMKNASLEV